MNSALEELLFYLSNLSPKMESVKILLDDDTMFALKQDFEKHQTHSAIEMQQKKWQDQELVFMSSFGKVIFKEDREDWIVTSNASIRGLLND